MVGDATNALLWSMQNEPDKWHVQRGVPVFKSHTRDFPEQKLTDGTTVPAERIVVTDDDLPRIARDANDRIARTGELPPLCKGHRSFDPKFPEHNQPELSGFPLNYRVEKQIRDGAEFDAIVCDEYVPVDKKAIYRSHPYRSAEYHPTLGIMGVAALVRPPHLNLGTTYVYGSRVFGRANGVISYAMGAVMADEFNPTAAATGIDDPSTAVDEAEYAKFKLMMDKYNAEMGGGAATPAMPATYAANLLPIQTQLAAMKQQLANAEAGRVKAEAGQMLDQAKDVIHFDYARELANLVRMPDEASRTAHVGYMLQVYEKKPVGGMIRTYQGPTAAPGATPDPNDLSVAPKNYSAAIDHMRRNPGMTYQAAEAAVAK